MQIEPGCLVAFGLSGTARSRIRGAWLLVACLSLLFKAQAGPGTALSFNGTNAYVQVPHNLALDSLPLTITAWVRTTRTSTSADGIVSKYSDAHFDGYSMHLLNGHVRAWYFRDSTDCVWDGSEGLDGGFIADGNWHHLAFVVDISGGRLFVDGTMKSNLTWRGTAQITTNTLPLQIGRYYTLGSTFLGAMDEVTLWNRALSTNEVNYLKHRLLPTNGDGLVSYWKLDDGLGSTASDSTADHFNGALLNGPQWIPSDAPVVLNPVATNCLKFSGANGIVNVADASDLNPYPFTATAWFRTQTNSSAIQVIAAKYTDVSYNGWAMVVQSGQLRTFLYRNGSLANKAIDALSGTIVADGGWHHAALIVDTNGGRMFSDGSLVVSNAWTGAAGATVSTTPLTLGALANGYPFLGDVDEVALWSRALSAGEIAAQMNLPRLGTEANLVGYWKLDDGGASTTAADSTTNAHTGALSGAVAWTGSTAYLGDGSVHLAGAMDFVNVSQTFAINTSPGQPAFLANSGAGFWRFYDFGSAPLSSSVVVQIVPGLRIASTGPSVNIDPAPFSAANTFGAYNAFGPIPTGTANGQLFLTPNFNLQPAPGVQLDDVDYLHQAVAVLSHSENGGAFANDATNSSAATRLLQFDGNLFFGSLLTVFTNVDVTPVVTNVVAGNHLDCLLVVSLNAGSLPSAPGHTYGAGVYGVALPVSLLVNGDAVLKAGATTAFTGPAPDVGTIQNISFSRNNSLLTSTGAVAYVDVLMPLGFSIGISPTNHETISFAPLGYVVLDANLNPTNNSYTVNGPLFGVEETLPYWFGAPNLIWQVNSGQIILNPNGTSVFVRQFEDDLLQSQTNLVDSTTTNRVSNDGYFRKAAPSGGSLVVTADTNGVAQISVQLALQPPELRPHFPYAGRTNGMQISTGSGLLVISNSLVSAGSYLNVPGAVPVAYGRDCAYVGCTAAQAGAAILPFTPTTAQLSFTPDGGLLAYGSVPPANLMWGYTTSGNFAQQAGTVTSGAFCMAGTFLRADQTALDDSLRPTVLLFSGFGDASNPAYVERPGQASYNNGFANYPGLNFRSPAQGESYVGQILSGWYALDPASKYYLRYGGVNGIHQAAVNAFPTSLKLYGYNFTFTDFGLSYLDGQNQDSVTTGAVSFPAQPAGFTQEFDKLKLTCRGDLDSASIPAGARSKHLAYWNADFTPQSIDFHPTNDDTCGTSPRFLVLGAETRLPFIPQALHAALGFKPNGNLVCPQDNVSNVVSRFSVPAQLSLQGPNNSLFTVSTAAEGYFNNWETPGASALGTGFYNLAGKIRVPFFTDVKVHLHVTPLNATTAQVDIMGGWPDPDSGAADLGWSVNNSNYFNLVEFDPHSDGWPVAQVPNLSNYRNSSTTQYHPRAQRDWLDVAKFDYPLVFDSVLRRFKGFQDAKVELPILDVNSRLKQLAPGLVDFDFAQDLSVQLPQVKVLNFVNDALDGDIGPLLSVSNAIRGALNQTLDVTGINSLSKALREDVQDFMNPILGSAIDPIVASLWPKLTALQQTNLPAFLQQVYTNITFVDGPLATGIGTLNSVSNQASSIVLTVNQTLTDVLNTAGLLDRIIAKDPSSGNRMVITTIIEKIIHDQAPDLGFVSSLVGPAADSVLNPLLTDLDPTLDEIQGDLEDVSNQLAQVQAQLNSTSGGFNEALGSVLQDATGVSNFLASAAQNITNYLASVITPAGDLLTTNPAAVQQTIRQQIATAFLSSVLSANYQSTFRNFLGDDNFALDQIMNSLFDQINGTIRNALSDQISGAQDGLFQNLKGAGLLGGTLLSAKIKGAPTFDGDSLRDIHLNAAIQMNIPDKMNFNAYMDIKELNSQSVPVACIPAGSPAAEITLGADKVPLNWAGVSSGQSAQSLNLSIQARWTQQGGAVIGIGGSLDIGGGASFEGCQLKDLGAALAIGQTENYFAAKVDATVPILGIPVNMKAGLFAGHACSLDPLRNIDSQVDQVLLNHPSDFTGVYVQYGGGLSLSDFLGLGGAGCLLDADATISTAYYWQGGASLGTIGGRQGMGVKISLLCVLSGELDYAQFLALDTSGALTIGGSANVCGSIGPCPFCVSGCKGVTIKGVVSTSGINYYIDY